MEVMRLGGVYLVIDPNKEKQALLNKLHEALKGGIRVVQVWNHWQKDDQLQAKSDFLAQVKAKCSAFDVPVLMHDDWELAIAQDVAGVHFDEVPEGFDDIKKALGDRLIGVTVGNDLDRIAWAEAQAISYISFCAVFPSSSVDTCDIVTPASIEAARKITQMPIFLSGGIQTSNLNQLSQLTFDGVAVISGILNADDPKCAVEEYIKEHNKIKKYAKETT